MASINRSRNTDFARVADDDPFAELTRIGGRNPHVSTGDRSDAASDPLGLDMENELLGDLARFERPDISAREPSEEIDPAVDTDALDLALDTEFKAAFEEEWGAEDIQAAPAAAELQEGLHSPEPETLAWDGGLESADPVRAADTEGKLHLFDRIAAELRANDSIRTGTVEDDEARTLSDEEITAFAAEWEEQNGTVGPSDAGSAASFDNPFAADEGEGDEPQAFAREPEPPVQVHEAGFEPVPAVDESAPELADEIPDLLLDSDLETAFSDEEQVDSEGEAEPSMADDAVPFDYDRAAADRHDHLGQVFDDVPPDAFEETEAAAPEAVEIAVASDPTTESDGTPGSRAAMTSAFATVPFWSQERQGSSAPHDGSGDRAVEESSSVADALQAESAVAADEPVAPEVAERPQVETIDMEDRVTAVVDDLDIPEPELPPEPTADSEFDELAAELAGAFGEMTDEALAEPDAESHEPQSAVAASVEAEQYLFDQPDAGTASPAVARDEQYQFETAATAAAFDAPFEPTGYGDFDQWAGDMDDEDAAAAPMQRRSAPLFARFGRRGMLGAAALAGLVVVGGASVFALSTGAGGLGQPALVKASDEPFKVKPKDPGGIKVSTDNNEVYQRASGAVGSVPEQKALLTTAEKPLDLSKTIAPRVVDASAVRNAASGDAASADDAWSKSEARLAPADETQAEDLPPALTVQARRVETFVVRPDGTLVPREPAEDSGTEIAATAPEAQAAGDDAVMDEGDTASAIAANASGGAVSAPADASAVEPAKETTTPAERPEPVAVASNAPSAPAEKPLAPAATQAASAWSVQISSQPSADAAQESYRRMAQRYGDLLAGRGVNIVKADISGKGTYYRVRIPSASKDEAIDLCTKLKGAGGNCFVSK